jgi:MFS family permease
MMDGPAQPVPGTPRELTGEEPAGAFPLRLIGVLFCLNALDGFDVLAISFAAPGIVREWGASSQALGLVISLGLLATGCGSLLVAPLADRVGRRPMIFASLGAMTLGMLICAAAGGIVSLSAGRVINGLGVGALVPCISALAAEYCTPRYRDRSVIIMAIGFPVGGLVGGQFVALLLQHFDWRCVFIAGCVATALLTLPAVWMVPESKEYLALRRAAGDERSVFDILRRPALVLITLTITLSYGLHGATLYYALNWIPKMVVDLSLSQSQAAAIAAWCSGGGIVGSLVAAALATRVEIRLLTVVALAGTSLFLWAFAHTPAEIDFLLLAALMLGAFLYGAQVSLYALMTQSFPVHVRATGVGFVTGVGRLGGVLSPFVSGRLLTLGLAYSIVSARMALGSLLAAVVLVVLRGVWTKGAHSS